MKRPWLGYLSSALLMFAGILQFAGGKSWLGALFVTVSVVNLVLQLYINKRSR